MYAQWKSNSNSYCLLLYEGHIECVTNAQLVRLWNLTNPSSNTRTVRIASLCVRVRGRVGAFSNQLNSNLHNFRNANVMCIYETRLFSIELNWRHWKWTSSGQRTQRSIQFGRSMNLQNAQIHKYPDVMERTNILLHFYVIYIHIFMYI